MAACHRMRGWDMKRMTCLIIGLLTMTISVHAEKPLIGAQIWIEPGQTAQEIEEWFKILHDHDMPLTRLFIMWNYLETAPDKWDFSLYDAAFRAAEKFNIKIVATLTANHGPLHHGYWYASQGSGIVDTEEHAALAQSYIHKVVNRYKASPALDTWMLMNEPGMSPEPHELAMQRFRDWLKDKYHTIGQLNQSWLSYFQDFAGIQYSPVWPSGLFTWPAPFLDWYTFWRDHMTWHLKWVADEIRTEDPQHDIHVNPHALGGNLAAICVDMPAWRPFLNSLGASIHPAWHFGLFRRDQFALGVSYVCDLIAGASEPHPFWVTELQGGNNIYSSTRPLCPSENDIAQWLWTGLGSGADRVIFWLLNARKQGGEAGEWSLLDFQNRPSERLRTAQAVARSVQENHAFFSKARAVDSPVTIILSLETMTYQERYRNSDFPGRDRFAHIQAALAFYEVLQELGIPVHIKLIHDFPWDAAFSRPQLVILPHVSVLSQDQSASIESFVKNGNTVLITGLTGLYDPMARNWPLDRFPLQHCVGGTLKEVRYQEPRFTLPLTHPDVALPSHLWAGEIDNVSGSIIGTLDGRISATRNRYGKGEAIWIPSMIDLGAWLYDRGPLARFIAETVSGFLPPQPVAFDQHQPGCLMRILENGLLYATVITNGTDEDRVCRLKVQEALKPIVLWGTDTALDIERTSVSLGPRETVVILWQ